MTNLAELPERSIVTVLAVDTVDSTGHIAGEDPDDAQELLDRIFDYLDGIIGGAGGLIVSYAGDGGIAVFGWPQSMEDHADRACTAAWQLQNPGADHLFADQSGRPIRFRVGLHSGLVGLRRMSRGRETRLDTVGGTVHLAAALQKKASPGGILISSKTLDLCHSELELGPHPDLPLFQRINAKVYRLEARPLPSATRHNRRGYRAPLMGRTAEREILRNSLVHRDSENHSAAIIGEPGIGKSRLAAAAIDDAHTSDMPMLVFYGDSQKRTTPFFAMRALFLDLLSLGEGASDDEIVQALAKGGITDLADNLLATVLLAKRPKSGSAATNQAQTPMQVARSLTQGFTKLSGSRARLIVIEDLHLVDLESMLCLRSLAEEKSGPWSLLITGRPEAANDAANIADVVLRLDALPRDEMRRLAAALWPDGSPPGPLLEEILDRADGVPFTLEQIILSANAGIDLAPQSVQSMIHARLNRLSPSAKACAQVLSVLGEEVETEIALKVLETGPQKMEGDLRQLELLEIIQPVDGPNIRFRHAIVAEACAETLPGPRRRELHRAAMDAVVSSYADLGPQFERLAFHAEGARDDERALQYLWQSAIRANRSYAAGSLFLIFQRAMGHIERIGGPADERFVDFVMMAFGQLMQIGEFAKLKPYLPRALELAQRQNRTDKVCNALCHMSLVAWFEGTYLAGRQSAERALKLAEELRSLPLIFYAKFLLASALYGLGEIEAAIELQRELSEIFRGDLESARLGSVAMPSSLVRSYLSWFMMDVGRYKEGLPHVEEGLAIALRHREPYAELLARLGLGRNLIKLKRYQEAADCLKIAVSLIGQYGYDPALPHILGLFASALTGIGQAEQAIRVVEEWLHRGLEERTGRLELYYLNAGYAEALFSLGKRKEALATVDRGLAIARSITNPCLIVQGLGLRAHLLKVIEPGSPQIAADLSEQAELCTRHGLVAERLD
jgi:class 3 adenylate cyclase/tetratricopeptide (TPR) repeat protein